MVMFENELSSNQELGLGLKILQKTLSEGEIFAVYATVKTFRITSFYVLKKKKVALKSSQKK